MSDLREKKLNLVANNIPLQEVHGELSGDTMVVSWGGTFGAVYMAVKNLQKRGLKVSHMHMKYLNPMPKNVESLLNGFKQVIVPELNNGQLKNILNAKFQVKAIGYNKMQGQPFKITELEIAIIDLMKEGKIL
jgi:2-oxoglutarate ferredoxin oxidoreductase subunit alpha